MRVPAMRVPGRGTIAMAGVALLLACGGAPPSPEDEIRAMLSGLEAAARDRDLAALKDVISGDYADPQGRAQADIHGILTYHYFRQESIHVLTKVEELELVADRGARLVVLGAMAATPIDGPDDLRRVRADVYRFELAVRREDDGAWRVTEAQWRPARLDDLV